jgi:hypothetical protein
MNWCHREPSSTRFCVEAPAVKVVDFGSRSLGFANPFLVPAGVATTKTAEIKWANRASRIGATTRQEHRADA